MKKALLLFLITFSFSVIAQTWNLRGDEILGEFQGERYGRSICLTPDANTIVVGADGGDAFGSGTGVVRVYDWNNVSWVQRGADLTGEAWSDMAGFSVSISDNGNVLFFGRINTDVGANDSGSIISFEWNGSSWVQKGNPVNGESADNNFGITVSSNSDGTVVTATSMMLNGIGFVKVFEWNGSDWTQRGNTIYGTSGDRFGASSSLNADGTVFVVGAPTASNGGKVQVFAWNGTQWNQKGLDLEGADYTTTGSFGDAVSISDDGNVIAVGAPNSLNTSGFVQMLEWNSTQWITKGNGITGEPQSRLGESVCISGDGGAVVSGALYYGAPNFNGQVISHKWNGVDWLENGNAIIGANGDQLGNAVSMNVDGTVIASGNFYFDSYAGQVKIYDFCGVDTSVTNIDLELTSNTIGASYQWLDCNASFAPLNGETTQSFTATSNGSFAVEVTLNGCVDTSACIIIDNIGLEENSIHALSVYPNPTESGIFTIKGDKGIKSIQVLDLMGREIEISVNLQEGTVNGSELSSGKYVVRIITNEEELLQQEIVVIK